MKRQNEFKLRLPLRLHFQLKEAASNAGVSLNTEITKRLDQLLDDDEFITEFIKSKSDG